MPKEHHKAIMKRSRLRNKILKHRTDTNKKTTAPKEISAKNSWKTLTHLILKILTLKNLPICPTAIYPKFIKRWKINLTDDSKIISSDEEPCETFDQFFSNVIPTLNIAKPKSFPMASDNLDPTSFFINNLFLALAPKIV